MPTLKRTKPHPRADTAERVRRVIDLTLAGQTNAQIGAAIGVDEKQVSRIRASENYQAQYAAAVAELEEMNRQRRGSINTKAWQVLEDALDGNASPIAAQTARWWVDRVEPVVQRQDVHLSGDLTVTRGPDLSLLDDQELRIFKVLASKATPDDDALPDAG